MGTASEMNPGLLPVLWIDDPPAAQAASMRSRTAGPMLPGWWNPPVVDTTLLPAAKSAHSTSTSYPCCM